MTSRHRLNKTQPKTSEIKTIIRGGLGNQILQYLASKHITEEAQFSSQILDLSWFLQPTDCEYQKQRKVDILTLLQDHAKSNLIIQYDQKKSGLRNQLDKISLDRIHIKEELLSSTGPSKSPIDEVIKKVQARNFIHGNSRLILDGFWQNPLPYLHKIIRYSEDFNSSANGQPNLINTEYISVHIRRGDYVKESNCALKYSSHFSTAQYVNLALQILPKYTHNMPLLVSTDDPEWCHKWIYTITQNANRQIIISSSSCAIDDWIALRNSRINIITNSTFSFTAAMLNTSNIGEKIRCIMPLWRDSSTTVHDNKWSSIDGSLDI